MTGGSGREQETESLRQLTEAVRTESNDGARLVADLANNPICRVTVDTGIPCIVLVWGQYATSAQLRFVHECALDAGLKAAASKCPDGFFGKQSVANVMSRAPSGVTLRSFDKLDEARAWLQTVQI